MGDNLLTCLVEIVHSFRVYVLAEARWIPTLIMTTEQIDAAVEVFSRAVESVARAESAALQ